MKKEHIEIGQMYAMKINGRSERVLIESRNPNGGYNCVVPRTKAKFSVKTAARFRYKISRIGGDITDEIVFSKEYQDKLRKERGS